ncbi:class IV adenylate cyclase [uncultured Desulfosarcina sp.]|uniref:class IV adenylate cyclase n=1 Tax=uncultured Desulfosarcina sp. TaxID=218289 RepID=UPI0029C7E9A2|nr:class IV adenylate cyclase [uncultured Desulfosarcina sp.]
MEHLEIELKFYVSDFDFLRSRLADLGAECIGQPTLEHNIRYETDDNRLLKNKCLLRLRRDRQTTLTFKSPPPEEDDRFKVYRELEVSISDFETMDAILNALGFFRRQVYEKRRETWQLNDALLCLDAMPFGSFLEIEGRPDTITQVVRDLGLAWEHRILANYLGMFETLKEKEGWTFFDVTFDNFADVRFFFERYRHLFEAGNNKQGTSVGPDTK